MEEPILPRNALLETLEDRVETLQLLQNKPYTCIVARSYYNEIEYIGYGFSKVCYPDRWDERLGADISRRRALYMILHEIRAHERSIRMQCGTI